MTETSNNVQDRDQQAEADDEYYERKLRQAVRELGIRCNHLVFEESCASVTEAAAAAGAGPDEFIKSVCLKGKDGSLLVAIVHGPDRIDLDKVGKVLGVRRPRLAGPAWAEEKSGYPAGGTPPFGFEARFIIDCKVLSFEEVYCGGGSRRSLLRIRPASILQTTEATVADIAQRGGSSRQ